MRLHLFSAAALETELAAHALTGKEQATYLAATCVVSLLPYYLFIVPPPVAEDRSWFYAMWGYEFFSMVVINLAGIAYCFRKCRVEPARNFLIDFSCLYVPILVTTLVAGWGLYYLLTKAAVFVVSELSFSNPPGWIRFFFSWRFYDLLRFAASVGIVAAVFIRIGKHMERVSKARETAV